jgi:hypothetical protein
LWSSGRPCPAIQALKIRAFSDYPKVGLTERARRNKSMTYPVVI